MMIVTGVGVLAFALIFAINSSVYIHVYSERERARAREREREREKYVHTEREGGREREREIERERERARESESEGASLRLDLRYLLLGQFVYACMQTKTHVGILKNPLRYVYLRLNYLTIYVSIQRYLLLLLPTSPPHPTTACSMYIQYICMYHLCYGTRRAIKFQYTYVYAY
jgi:hypothetical protein